MHAARVLRQAAAASTPKPNDADADGNTIDEAALDKLKKVRVFVRLRPCLPPELKSGATCKNIRAEPETGRVSINNVEGSSNNVFTFDGVLGTTAQQPQVYDAIGASDIVSSVLLGYNATVFAYGQTGSGKTHTVEGPQQQKLDPHSTVEGGGTEGITPRAVREVFRRLAQSKREQGTGDYIVECSYLEIYNEEVFDLLSSSVTKSEHGSTKSKASTKSNMRIRWSRRWCIGNRRFGGSLQHHWQHRRSSHLGQLRNRCSQWRLLCDSLRRIGH